MKILYSWLKDFIDIDPAQLVSQLGALGVEVASVQKTGADFDNVYAAKILKIERHPNADKLSLVELDNGTEIKKVVCGAQNLEVGITVPLARAGSRLGDIILQPAEIRGVKSDGMICSSDELGLTNTRAKGILHLDPSVKPGTDVSTLYPKADYVYELEITPNRPDLLSHLGIARELSVLLSIPLKMPEIKAVKEEGDTLKVTLSAGACHRYTSRTVRGVTNTASPQWMQARLGAMGVNPKNALVDISNYVLYDIGLPLHFFDVNDIDSEVNVRYGVEGEKFETLDGTKLELLSSDLVIADAQKAICLAGVMGGAGSGIKEDTKDLFIEAAYFDAPTINKTAKKYGFSSEASQRFERGADIGITRYALDRATNLVQEICGGAASKALDVYPEIFENPEVVFNPAEIAQILGMEIEQDKLADIFGALGQVFSIDGDVWKFTAPSHRRDLNHKWDLAEEAARFNGFENIPVSSTRASVAFADNPKNVDTSAKFAASVLQAGFCECKNFDFVSLRDLTNFGFDKKDIVEIANPLNEQWQYMRPNLLAGLLKNAAFNQSRSTLDYKLFEVGKEYLLAKGFPAETWHLTAIACGKAGQDYFGAKSAKADFYFIKGVAEAVLRNTPGVSFAVSAKAPGHMHPKVCMDIMLDGKAAGCFGKLHPLTAKAYGLKNDDIYALDLNIKMIEKKFSAQDFTPASPVAEFPSSYRDLSFVVEAGFDFGKAEAAIAGAGVSCKMSYTLMDVYTGSNLPAGKKSFTVNFAFWLMERTLKDSEVEENINKIISALGALGAELRK